MSYVTTRWGKSLDESLGRPLKADDVLAAEIYVRWEQDFGRRIAAFDVMRDASKLEKASQLLDTLLNHVAFECGGACAKGCGWLDRAPEVHHAAGEAYTQLLKHATSTNRVHSASLMADQTSLPMASQPCPAL